MYRQSVQEVQVQPRKLLSTEVLYQALQQNRFLAYTRAAFMAMEPQTTQVHVGSSRPTPRPITLRTAMLHLDSMKGAILDSHWDRVSPEVTM
jgi:hypothetical protein